MRAPRNSGCEETSRSQGGHCCSIPFSGLEPESISAFCPFHKSMQVAVPPLSQDTVVRGFYFCAEGATKLSNELLPFAVGYCAPELQGQVRCLTITVFVGM